MTKINGEIIAITDDRILRAVLEDAFQAQALPLPVFAASAAEALDHGAAGLYIAAGGDVCAALLGRGVSCPVIAILDQNEARPPLPERDIFVRPFRIGLLLSRIAAHSGGKGARQPAAIAVGPFTLQLGTGVLTRAGREAVQLTEKERDILLALYRRGGATVGRKELLDDVWGYGDGIETHTLETHIYRLRQKIEDDPAHPVHLITEEPGYRLG